MIAVVKDNMKALQQVCKSRLYLLDSAARETGYNDLSDIDFLFRFEPRVECMETEKKPDYLELLSQLENRLHRKVDLGWIDGVTNPYFIQSIKKDLIPIYGA